MVFGRTISSCADMVTQVSACEWNHKGYIFYYKLFFSVVIITDPTDSSISTIAVSISSASVTCTDDEVSSLKTLETDLETMEAAIDSALTAVQAALAGAEIIKYSFFYVDPKRLPRQYLYEPPPQLPPAPPCPPARPPAGRGSGGT